MSHPRTYGHLQLFCGLGGLSAGIQAAVAQHAGLRGRWACLAAIDSDPGTIRAYNNYTASTAGHVVDLFSREQYEAFHGSPPPPDWREATPETIQRLCGGRVPDLVASSPPCKGFSGLLPEGRSQSARYQALNGLVFRGIWLTLEAFAGDPPPFWLLENVPRIQSRGAHYLEQLRALFASYGYSVTGEEHCCGELGGLAQRRRRYLLVARHREKVPPLLYRPETRPLRTVGEVLGRLPLPGDPRAGTMHEPRRTTFRTALRLALIPPGKDWRALRDLRVVDGALADYHVVPVGAEWHGGILGVNEWDRPSCTVKARAGTNTGAYNVADPRSPVYLHHGAFGVTPWAQPGPTVTGAGTPSHGRFAVADPRPGYGHDYGMLAVRAWGGAAGAVTCASAGNGQSIADPRLDWHPGAHRSKLRVVPWQGVAGAVATAQQVGSGAGTIADPRTAGVRHNNVFRVVALGEPSPAVTAGSGTSAGALALADPRTPRDLAGGTAWRGGGPYGVVPWSETAGAVTASADAASGACSVADPRPLPAADDLGVWVVLSPHGGAWHRPFTTLELAAIQSLVTADDLEAIAAGETTGPASLATVARADTQRRQLIGNAVPPATARAIGEVILKALLSAEAGETFTLTYSRPWAIERRLAAALAVAR